MPAPDPHVRPPLCSDWPVWRVWTSAFHAPALAIADELGLFAALAADALAADALAAVLALEVRAVEALAGLMVQLEFLARVEGRFLLTDVARTYLLADSPYYWGPFLARIRQVPLDCARLVGALRRGAAAAEARVSQIWESEAPPAPALAAFTRAMHSHSFALAMRVIPAFGLGSATRLLDGGGGSGSYSIAAAIRHPGLRATVLDFEAVCEVAREYAAQYGVANEVATAAVDLFQQSWPPGHDTVLMSDIFHDWDDERCVTLARRAYDALAPGGRILVHEMLLSDAKDGPLEAAAYSVVMIFTTRGTQRTGAELRALLERAGFRGCRIAMTSGGYALLEGHKQAE